MFKTPVFDLPAFDMRPALAFAFGMSIFCSMFCIDAVAQSNQQIEPEIASDIDPKPGGPSRPDPYGGDKKAQFVAFIDLALKPAGIRLGDVDIPWGNSATVKAQSAAYKKEGRCAFRYRYATINDGQAASLPTKNRIMLQTQDGAVLSSRPLPALIAGASANSSAHVLLAPGEWMLYVRADATDSNNETNEKNNLRRVKVKVLGNCN